MAERPRPNALSNSKLNFMAFNNETKRPITMSWRLARNNVELICDTGDPAMKNREKNWGKIKVPMSYRGAALVMGLIQQASLGNAEYCEIFQAYNHRWVNNQREKEITHMHDIVVQRSAEGVVSVTVIYRGEPGWPELKFILGLPDNRYEKLAHADGSQWTKAKLSQLVGRQMFDTMIPLLAHLGVTEYQPPEPPSGGAGSGGGGGNRGGYSGGAGGGQRPQAPRGDERPSARGGYGGGTDDVDDDIPY